MNFQTVKTYVNTATNAGLNVYGHTLAWHSQQPNGWLRGLIKDKPAPELTDGDVTVTVPVASKDFRTNQSVGWTSDKNTYGFTITFSGTDGMKVHTTKICTNSWDVQFIAMSDIPTDNTKKYKMTMTVRGSKSGTLHSKLGDWNGGANANIPFTSTWQDVEVTYNRPTSNAFLLLQCGDYMGDIYIKNIKFEEEKMGKTVNEERRCLVVHSSQKVSEVYDTQFWIVPGTFVAGSSYTFSAEVRATKPATASTQIHNDPSNYVHYEALGNINFTTEWKTVTASGTLSKSGKSIAFNLNELADANDYYFDNISFKVNGVEKIQNGTLDGDNLTSFRMKEYGQGVTSPNLIDSLSYVYVPSTIPLSPEERHDTLVWAMDKWIKGMMEACNGKVKAWDLVNEAISGGGDDGQGNYTLQHSQGYNPNGTWDVGGDAFYWQDFMGDLEYVRQAHRLARKYGPEDAVLFINDYNLESDWDGNKKLKSLINWIKKWEADGVTHIDGIGTQMHISYYANTNTQNSKKNAITNMFRLMAATGKYVRVSEFDMGYVDANGNNVATANMTEQQHHDMEKYYEWILKQFFEIVPPAQQWGICHWCPTDSPANSGWRANTPVGLWTLDYYRKHAYAGYAKGLGADPTDINLVPTVDDSAETSIFDIHGHRLPATSTDALPSGLYIVNGKKVLVK
ncbi:MAG: endo-1,4-beta-xylanase [Bacteroidales bacterium]|nr:endo-1,4-beta-xylanase [Candidatus Liminaster caballi]